MAESIKEIDDADAFEQTSGKLLKCAMMIVMFVPGIITLLGAIQEWLSRPTMVVAPAELGGMHAVVTGGCSAAGLDLALMLAEAGAGVVVGCYGALSSEVATTRIAAAGLHRVAVDDDGFPSGVRGWVDVWSLELESFDAVRTFAARVSTELPSLHLLVHAAASIKGCTLTADGHEYATQVNLLSPYLLTRLLSPHMQGDGSAVARGARIVFVTCDSGLQLADWLPWPLRRIAPDAVPRVDLSGLDPRAEGKELGCMAGQKHANAKLSLVLLAAEINRRLVASAHSVNPGAMVGGAAAPTTSTPSLQARVMAYLPPVWVMGKVRGAISSAMKRTVRHGATAIFHVATSAALASSKDGGALYSDAGGAFLGCGRPAAHCGRLPAGELPPAVTDKELARHTHTHTRTRNLTLAPQSGSHLLTSCRRLWERLEAAIGTRHMLPVAAGAPYDALREPDFDMDFD